MVVALFASSSLHAIKLWDRVKSWFTAQPTNEQLECPEFIQYRVQPSDKTLPQEQITKTYDPFAFQQLPFDLQRQVLLLIARDDDIETSTTILRSFLQTSKLNNILSRNNFYQTLVEVIARKYGVLPQLVQLYVGSQIDRLLVEKYIKDNSQAVFELQQQAKYLHYVLDSKKSYEVLKLLTDKIPFLRAHNEPDCLVVWRYANKKYVCVKTPVQLPLETSLARKTIMGYADTTFGGQTIEYPANITPTQPDGYTKILNTVPTSDIAMQQTGKIVIVLYDINHGFMLVRFNPSGTLDTSFAQNGFLALDIQLLTEEIISYFNALMASGNIVYHLFIDPKNDHIIFNIKDIVKQFTNDGKELP